MVKVKAVNFEQIYLIISDWKWTPIGLQTMKYNREEIEAWVIDNCKGLVAYHCALFGFEKSQDAFLFALRWLEATEA